MAERILIIELAITVRDLDKGERKGCTEGACMSVRDIPKLTKADFREIPQMIAAHLEQSDQQEVWAGSAIFARIESVDLLSWKFSQ